MRNAGDDPHVRRSAGVDAALRRTARRDRAGSGDRNGRSDRDGQRAEQARGPLPGSSSNARREEPRDDWAQAFEEAKRDLAALGGSVKLLGRLQLVRLQWGARAGAFQLVLGAWLATVAIALSVTAAVLLTVGLAQGVSAATDSSWAGSAVVGALVLATLGVTFAWLRRRMERKFSQKLQRRFGPDPADPTPTPEAPHGS